MVNYKLGKIYKIVNDNIPDKVYYGATAQKYLSSRFCGHRDKDNKCKSTELFEIEGARIELVENFPCDNVYELKNRERYYIENNECINKQIPNQTREEYWNTTEYKERTKKDRQTKYKERIQNYYKENKEKMINTQLKKYNEFKNSYDSLRICCRTCKKEVSIFNWKVHTYSKKHQSNLT